METRVDATTFAANRGGTSVKCAKVERHTLRKRKCSLYGFVYMGSFERKKSQIREEFVESPLGATTFAANPRETSVKCAKVERHTLRKRKGSFYGFVFGIDSRGNRVLWSTSCM